MALVRAVAQVPVVQTIRICEADAPRFADALTVFGAVVVRCAWVSVIARRDVWRVDTPIHRVARIVGADVVIVAFQCFALLALVVLAGFYAVADIVVRALHVREAAPSDYVVNALSGVLQTEVIGAVVVIVAINPTAGVNHFNDFNFCLDFMNVLDIWHVWPDIRHVRRICACVSDVWDVRYFRINQFIGFGVRFVGRVLVRRFSNIWDTVVQFAGFAVGILGSFVVVHPCVFAAFRRSVVIRSVEADDFETTAGCERTQNHYANHKEHRLHLDSLQFRSVNVSSITNLPQLEKVDK